MKNSKGFTIIELLIATSVFSFILLILTAGIMQIGRAYQKGITQSKVLNTARSITDELAQAIQFAGGDISGEIDDGTNYAYCVGGRLYSFRKGVQLDGTNHALMTSRVPDCSSSPAPLDLSSPPDDAQELLGPGMILSRFNILPDPGGDPSLYSVNVRIVYGDLELLCSPSLDPGDCSDNSSDIDSSNLATFSDDIRCIDGKNGTQFCGVSEFTTSAQRRIRLP